MIRVSGSARQAVIAIQGLPDMPDGAYTVDWDAPPARIETGKQYRITIRIAAAFPSGTGQRDPNSVPFATSAFVWHDAAFTDLSPDKEPGRSTGYVTVSASPARPPILQKIVVFEMTKPGGDHQGYPETTELAVYSGGSWCEGSGCGYSNLIVTYTYKRVPE